MGNETRKLTLEADKTTALGRGGNLRDIHGDLGGAYSDRETVDDATDGEHRNVNGGANDHRTNYPARHTCQSFCCVRGKKEMEN